MKIAKEFAAFINRGNIVDMAVGVVVGGAFGKIVTSLVSDIITPFITLISGSSSHTAGKLILKAAEVIDGVEIPEVAVNYGNFIQTIFDFLIIALSIFLVLKLVTTAREKAEALRKKEEEKAEEAAPAPAEPSNEEKLLAEIRDLLREKN